MSQTISERLEYLRKANSNRQWKNDDLYRLLYSVNARVILRRNNFDPPCQIPFPFTS